MPVEMRGNEIGSDFMRYCLTLQLCRSRSQPGCHPRGTEPTEPTNQRTLPDLGAVVGAAASAGVTSSFDAIALIGL